MGLRTCLFSVALVTAVAHLPAWADGKVTANASVKISIKADVDAKAAVHAAAGDAAMAAGRYEVALAAYGEGFAATRDAAFVYAMAHAHKALGHTDDAKLMFHMYLSAKGTLKYKGEVEGELTGAGKSVVGTVTGIGGKVKEATVKVVDVGAGVFGAVKLGIAGSVGATAKIAAKAGDDAYAAGKYGEAAGSYLQAYASSQQSITLYAAAQAKAQAGAAIEARALLLGYLAADAGGKYAKDARTLLLAVGGHVQAVAKVSVKAKVSADLKAQVDLADKAFAAGRYLDAVKAYGEANAKKSEAVLLYARGIAQLYAGQTADAATSLKAYLAAGGNLELKASAETNLRLCTTAG